MPMTKQQKANLLAELDATLADAKGVVFANYQGLKVAEVQKVRKQLLNEAVKTRVVKNTILRLALRKHNIAIDESILAKPILLAASKTDEVSAAKTIKGFMKEYEALQIAGGIVDNRFLAASDMKTLAELPSRDQLRAQVVGLLASPLTGFLRVLKAPMGNLVSVLSQYQANKQ